MPGSVRTRTISPLSKKRRKKVLEHRRRERLYRLHQKLAGTEPVSASSEEPSPEVPQADSPAQWSAIVFLVGLAAYLTLFYTTELPSVPSLFDSGEPVRRIEWLVVFFNPLLLVQMWFGGEGATTAILDRLGVVFVAGAILAFVYVPGRLLLDACRADRLLSPVEVFVFSMGVGLNVVSSTPDIFTLQKNALAQGRFFTWLDDADARRICVLGGGAKRELFPLEAAVGSEIRIGQVLHTVVGVLAEQSTGGELEGFKIRDRNTDVYIPLSSSLNRFPPQMGETQLHRIVVQLPDVTTMSAFGNVIERVLSRRHHNIVDFKVVIPEQLLAQHQQTQRIFNIVMGTIASISLLVGGIGIMNIMLASVLERTREIGVRRALGARQSDIARQFLAEATCLSLFGGLVGVIVGIVLANVISLYADWETAVSLWSIFVAVGVSVGVGIVFGYLPARSAAKLDPIMALRFE